MLERVDDAGVLADLIASNVEATVDEKQTVLETVELVSRMRRVLELLSRQLEVLKLSNKISSQVKGEMSKTQREYYLRQQLKAIKDELGEGDDGDDDLAELEARVNDANLPEDAEKAARKELRRLRNMWHFANLAQYIAIFGDAVRIDKDFDMEVRAVRPPPRSMHRARRAWTRD